MIIACPKCGAKNRVDERGKAMQPVCGRCGAALPALSSAPIAVTDTSFAEVVLRSPIPVLVDCWAPWCGPCTTLEPLLDDQENDTRLSTGAIYWEGAVRALENGTDVGRGYLELTGYGEKLRLR